MSIADQTAFPQSAEIYGGLTKLEYFAGLAMQGQIAADPGCNNGADMIAQCAVSCAQALIAELEKVSP